MTEPTWKDPLLAKWWRGCSKETRRNEYLARNLNLDPGHLTAASVLAYWLPSICAEWTDRDRLRSLIDAELARGREAKSLFDLRGLHEMTGELSAFKQAVAAKVKFIESNREKLLEAWFAETGVPPSQSCLVIQTTADGGSRCWVERREPAHA